MELHVNALLIHRQCCSGVFGLQLEKLVLKRSNKAAERFQAGLKYLSVMRRGKMIQRMIKPEGYQTKTSMFSVKRVLFDVILRSSCRSIEKCSMPIFRNNT